MGKGTLIFSLLLIGLAGYIVYLAFWQPETFDQHVRALRRQKSGMTEATNHKPGTCTNTVACEGANAKLCFHDWLTRSKCFSSAYVERHFEKFSSELNESQPADAGYVLHTVRYNVVLNRTSICDRSDCFAYVRVYPDHSQVETVRGPLHEFALPVDATKAQTILTTDDECHNAKDLKLVLTGERFDPEADKQSPPASVFQAGQFNWIAKTDEPDDFPESCGVECTIDPISGQLTKAPGKCLIP